MIDPVAVLVCAVVFVIAVLIYKNLTETKEFQEDQSSEFNHDYYEAKKPRKYPV